MSICENAGNFALVEENINQAWNPMINCWQSNLPADTQCSFHSSLRLDYTKEIDATSDLTRLQYFISELVVYSETIAMSFWFMMIEVFDI